MSSPATSSQSLAAAKSSTGPSAGTSAAPASSSAASAPTASAPTAACAAKVGILGGGQLGRMMAMAGLRLGISCRLYDESPEAVARECGELIVGQYTDLERLSVFESGLDVVTYEFENVPAAAAQHLAARVPTYPPATALATCQDRLAEKSLFRSLGIGTPAFAKVDTREELDAAVKTLGLPAVLKTRRFGYDGKGQAVLRDPRDVAHAWTVLGAGAAPLILEAFVPFEREVSIIAVRARPNIAGPASPATTPSATGPTADVRFYPLVENHHAGGILRLSIAPAPHSAALQVKAEELARRVIEKLDYVGVLAVELFELGGELLANEIAPRVHNSGHWTIDGAVTSQFENHLRAVLGWPLGDCSPRGHAAMLNLIGAAPPLATLLALPGAHVEMYGKIPRPGRKLGHVNFVEQSATTLARNLAAARPIIEAAAC